MRPIVKTWIDFELDNFGPSRILIACYDYDDVPEVLAIQGLHINKDMYVDINEDDDFDVDSWITSNDWGGLQQEAQREITECYQDMMVDKADRLLEAREDMQDG